MQENKQSTIGIIHKRRIRVIDYPEFINLFKQGKIVRVKRVRKEEKMYMVGFPRFLSRDDVVASKLNFGVAIIDGNEKKLWPSNEHLNKKEIKEENLINQ